MPSIQQLVTVFAIGSVALLTACAPDTHMLTPTEAAPSSVLPTGEGTFDPVTDPVNSSVGVDCRTLIDDQTIYDWGNGNYSLNVNYEPAVGSAAAELVELGGIACSWINLTSSETVDVAVAVPSSTQLAAAQSAAAGTGEPAPQIAEGAYFSTEADRGYVDVFTDRYWIAGESVWFASASDAAPLLSAALDALG